MARRQFLNTQQGDCPALQELALPERDSTPKRRAIRTESRPRSQNAKATQVHAWVAFSIPATGGRIVLSKSMSSYTDDGGWGER